MQDLTAEMRIFAQKPAFRNQPIKEWNTFFEVYGVLLNGRVNDTAAA